MAGRILFTVHAQTDIGKQRAVNEDALAILDTAKLRLQAQAAFVVADGMGGMQSGEAASREAVRVIQQTLATGLARANVADPQAALSEALRVANETVYALAHRALAPVGTDRDEVPTALIGPGAATIGNDPPGVMGTTCIAGVVHDDRLYLAHVGDSRAYLLRGGRLMRLTRDHSFVEERVVAGDLTEEEARKSRFRNMITRAIGLDARIEPDMGQEPLHGGDLLLVCTDGLTAMLSDDAIEATLARGAALEQTAEALIAAANREGGADNITLVLLRADAVREPTKVPPGTRGRVIDLDTPRRPARRGAAAWLAVLFLGFLVLLGAATLALAAVVAVSPAMRSRALTVLGAITRGPVRPAPPDLGRFTYDPPELFSPYLARGDVLAYSARGYLYFVGDASGKVVYLNRRGELLKSVATLPIAPPTPTPIASSRNFVATDTQGNLYLSLTARKVIEKRDPQGRLLTTIRGLQRPEALAVDEDGNVYVVDFNQVKILRALPVANRAAQAASAPPAGARPGP